MGGDRDGDERHRRPQPARRRDKHHRHDAQRAQQHRHQARVERLHAAHDQQRRKGATEDAADVRHQVDDDQRRTEFGDADAELELLVQVRRQPVQVEPEHRCGEHVADRKGPGGAHAQHVAVRHLGSRCFDGALDVGQFTLGHAWMLVRVVIIAQPEKQPHRPGRANHPEHLLPAPYRQHEGHQHRREHRADIGAGVENADRDAALAHRKPQTGGFDAGGVITRFRQPQHEAANHEAADTGRKPVRGGRDAPYQYRQREAALDAHRIHQATLQHVADRVANLEPEIDVGVVLRRPLHGLGQHRLQDAERGAVDVIEGGGKEHQPEHAPAHPAPARLVARQRAGGMSRYIHVLS